MSVYFERKDSMKIEISDDTQQELFNTILVRDYKMLKDDIEQYTAAGHAEDENSDYADAVQYVAAMEVLFKYYLTYSEFSQMRINTTNEGN